MEYMKSRLTGNPCFGFLGRVRRRLVHHDHQVPTRMMFEYLREVLDDFLRGDTLYQ